MNPPYIVPSPPVHLAHSVAWTFTGFFAVAAFIAALTTMFILKTQQSIGMDQPDARRKMHEKPISRLGGGAIFLALVVGFLLALQAEGIEWGRWWPVMLCNMLVFAVGFFDDLKALGAKTKLVGQIGASLILYALGVSIDILSNPFGEGSINLGWLSLPLTLIWLVAIPNIVNLIDGMDGLATGFGLFVSLTLAFVGYLSGQPDVVYACVVMSGALAGFLIFNFPPAKIFLGDGGAYLIGFYIASVSVLSSNKGSIIAALLVMMVALGVPILDTLFAIMRRAIRGVPIFKADAEHIHHRLILLGYSKGQALVALYAVCFALSLVGLSILLTKGLALPVAGAVLFILAMSAAKYLGYVRTWKGMRRQINAALERRREIEYINAHARLLELEAEKCASAEEFAAILGGSLSRLGLGGLPGDGTKAVDVRLADGCIVRLYCSLQDRHHAEDAVRIDAISPCLNTAWERWRTVPGLTVVVPEMPAASSSS
ncbi:MAG: undecaprenyl/decaprenyl-phosphate alpha-N-acetylglucosaminyl 1-phosphate transferase [Verrucomicrobiaceae bacterium]|nr:undecaprenyl/decaprenyl-phosphate alpha-N-acetylglucosaminyl 1-phosphate transferase [Verrucomicrobiaceae bacterium]